MPSAADLEEILDKIRKVRNFDFHNYKRGTLRRRVNRRMADRKCKSAREYLALLDGDPLEFDALVSGMLIKVTSFFRDEDIWRELAARVVPELLARRRVNHEVRIWCAGCATGQEAYSIAILFAEALGSDFRGTEVKVFGTDVDEAALSVARRGVYVGRQLESMPKELRARWFAPLAEGYQVRKEIRRMVVFGVNNLVSDAPISRLDLLLCRNVFIYLDAQLQRRVLERFHYALQREGVLVLGRSELIPFAAKLFQTIDLSRRIYRNEPGDGHVALSAPLPPLEPASPQSPRPEESVLNQHHRDVLYSMPIPVIAAAVDGTISVWNRAAASLWSRTEGQVLGKKLASLDLPGLPVQALADKTARVRDGKAEVEALDATLRLPGNAHPVTLNVELSALRDQAGSLVGILYVVQDVTALRGLEVDLRRAAEDLTGSQGRLRVSSDDLQASNEELETTNEELQSSNEELQTTNEELQSTNEELETTNEELQSANEELDAINRELASRTEEMHRLGLYQRTIIRSLSAAVVVIDDEGRITAWNLAAERLLGLAESEALGQFLWNLRVPSLKRTLVTRIRRALADGRALRVDAIDYELPSGGKGFATVAAVPLVDGTTRLGAVILFEDTTRAVGLAKENLDLKKKKKK